MKIVERKLQVQLQPQKVPYNKFGSINIQYVCINELFFFSKVGVHNGWTFVSKPHSMVLDPEYTGQVTIGNRPNSMSSLKGNGQFQSKFRKLDKFIYYNEIARVIIFFIT